MEEVDPQARGWEERSQVRGVEFCCEVLDLRLYWGRPE